MTRRAFPIVLLLVPGEVFAQCSLCRDAISAAPLETREAMNYAILSLALAPYLIAAFAVWILVPGVRSQVRAGLRRLVPRRQEPL
jgi:hypothetical protein